MNQEKNIYHFKTLTSTMDIASELANKNCPNFTVVLADQQSSGCGRMGRIWYSELGGLYFSTIIRPEIMVHMGAHIGFAVAIEMANTIRDLFRIDAQLKWPNDILVSNHKICGILSRVKVNKNNVLYANVGVGLNVNNNPSSIESRAISILNILDRKVKIFDILKTFLSYIQSRINHFNSLEILQQWKLLNTTLGRFVRIITYKDQIEGMAIDLDSSGNLEILTADGSIKTVAYGECFHC